jgi:hypothetical protein
VTRYALESTSDRPPTSIRDTQTLNCELPAVHSRRLSHDRLRALRAQALPTNWRAGRHSRLVAAAKHTEFQSSVGLSTCSRKKFLVQPWGSLANPMAKSRRRRATRDPFLLTANMVRWIRFKHRIPGRYFQGQFHRIKARRRSQEDMAVVASVLTAPSTTCSRTPRCITTLAATTSSANPATSKESGSSSACQSSATLWNSSRTPPEPWLWHCQGRCGPVLER